MTTSGGRSAGTGRLPGFREPGRVGRSLGRWLFLAASGLSLLAAVIEGVLVFAQQSDLGKAVPRQLTVVADPYILNSQNECPLTVTAVGVSGRLHVVGACYLSPGSTLQGWVSPDRNVSFSTPPSLRDQLGVTLFSAVVVLLLALVATGLLAMVAWLLLRRRM